jgi:hypothetical protein
MDSYDPSSLRGGKRSPESGFGTRTPARFRSQTTAAPALLAVSMIFT